jgi:hypothetical protein
VDEVEVRRVGVDMGLGRDGGVICAVVTGLNPEEGKGGGRQDEKRKGKHAGGVVYGVMRCVRSVGEEEVIVGKEAGDDCHRDLDETALIGSGDEIEGGQREAEDGAEEIGDGEIERG